MIGHHVCMRSRYIIINNITFQHHHGQKYIATLYTSKFLLRIHQGSAAKFFSCCSQLSILLAPVAGLGHGHESTSETTQPSRVSTPLNYTDFINNKGRQPYQIPPIHILETFCSLSRTSWILHPWKLTWNIDKTPKWKGQPSSKPPFLGSMLILGGVLNCPSPLREKISTHLGV